MDVIVRGFPFATPPHTHTHTCVSVSGGKSVSITIVQITTEMVLKLLPHISDVGTLYNIQNITESKNSPKLCLFCYADGQRRNRGSILGTDKHRRPGRQTIQPPYSVGRVGSYPSGKGSGA